MDVYLTLVLNGIANGALYFLLAAGLTLIFGLMRVINFAHGGLFLWGAYISTFLYASTHQFVLSIIGGILVAGVLGLLLERWFIAPVFQNGTGQVLVTMGVMLVLQELVKIPFGPNSVGSMAPDILNHSWIVGNVVVVEYQLFLILVGVLIYLVLLLLLKRTRLGITIRAGIHNPDLVQARGIPIRRVFTMVFILGAALAGLAGALSGPYFGAVTPDIGINMQLDAFIIVVVGGLGSLSGSFLGSLLIGMVTAFVSYYFSSFAVLVDVLVMAIVLLIRPNGLFGEREAAS